MSTKTIEMYQAVCDGCGKVYDEDIDDIIAWASSEQAETAAIQGEWHRSLKSTDLLCPDCYYKEDDEDES